MLLTDESTTIRGVGRPRERKPNEPETDTQRLFVRRVLEELGEESVASLARRSGLNQRGLNAVLKDGTVPTLTTIHKVARALEKHVWELFRDADKKQHQEIPTGKVHHLPKPPKIFAPQQNHRAPSPLSKRNKTRA
jgi:transcriptional regulator with XRE-family HTH domain